MKITAILPILILPALPACGQASQKEIDYPLAATGQPATMFDVDGWQVLVTTAKIGFGPAYFCATAAANTDLCPTALAEFADTATVDALTPSTQAIGTIHGVTGRVRSVGYDFALTWFPRQTNWVPTAGAPGGHSAHFEGRASKGATAITFVADIDVVPQNQGALAVQGPSVDAEVHSAAVTLAIGFDAGALWKGVDFDDLAKIAGANGAVAIAKDSRAYNALVFAMTVGAPPTFVWRSGP